jgi:hypothetical protein
MGECERLECPLDEDGSLCAELEYLVEDLSANLGGLSFVPPSPAQACQRNSRARPP